MEKITPEAQYHSRREFIRNALLTAGSAGLFGGVLAYLSTRGNLRRKISAEDLAKAETLSAEPQQPGQTVYTVDEARTPFEDVVSYNNYYEFGTNKSDPARTAGALKTRPWTVAIEGEVSKPQTIDIDTLLKLFPLEERVYRMRCVEAWSMVISWLGFPLGKLLERVEPTSKAKFVQFKTLYDEAQMPGLKSGGLDWPYREGLRLDEAMHPLTLIALGLYGKRLLNQNGAPLRLVVPWKYGFKGIKSIVSIRLTEHRPSTSWNLAAPDEYGFYANVNPEVDHPRWSQARERRIGEGQRPTLPFNGYAEQVAHLYKDLDLRKHY